jgi:hypothetical protein
MKVAAAGVSAIREGPMAYYRLYFLDGLNRRITGFEEFVAATDASALVAAENRRRLVAMELWCEGRKVRQWEPLELAPPSHWSATARSRA